MTIDDLLDITDSYEIADVIIDRYYYDDERYTENRPRARSLIAEAIRELHAVRPARCPGVIRAERLAPWEDGRYNIDAYLLSDEDGVGYGLMNWTWSEALAARVHEGDLKELGSALYLAAVIFELTFYGWRAKEHDRNLKKEERQLAFEHRFGKLFDRFRKKWTLEELNQQVNDTYAKQEKKAAKKAKKQKRKAEKKARRKS